MGDFTKLRCWIKAREMSKSVYQVTAGFPASELYNLTDQMRRAASSIISNIAEGSGRNSNQEFRRFLTIAAGSAAELESQIIQATDLAYLSEPTFTTLSFKIQEIRKMLDRFIKYLENEIRQQGRIR